LNVEEEPFQKKCRFKAKISSSKQCSKRALFRGRKNTSNPEYARWYHQSKKTNARLLLHEQIAQQDSIGSNAEPLDGAILQRAVVGNWYKDM